MNRDILLLIDNCIAHIVARNLERITELHFCLLTPLPQSKTVIKVLLTVSMLTICTQYVVEILQAMDAALLDANLSCTASEIARKTTIMDVLHMTAYFWKRISESTIRNCFRHGGFSKDTPGGD